MTRLSDNYYQDGRLWDGYDYENQAWVKDGKYVRCGHPESMNCQCYGRLHAGENTVKECPECHGRTVVFKGTGMNTQYKICSRYKEPGHLSETEIAIAIGNLRNSIRPSGRWA